MGPAAPSFKGRQNSVGQFTFRLKSSLCNSFLRNSLNLIICIHTIKVVLYCYCTEVEKNQSIDSPFDPSSNTLLKGTIACDFREVCFDLHGDAVGLDLGNCRGRSMYSILTYVHTYMGWYCKCQYYIIGTYVAFSSTYIHIWGGVVECVHLIGKSCK